MEGGWIIVDKQRGREGNVEVCVKIGVKRERGDGGGNN